MSQVEQIPEELAMEYVVLVNSPTDDPNRQLSQTHKLNRHLMKTYGYKKAQAYIEQAEQIYKMIHG